MFSIFKREDRFSNTEPLHNFIKKLEETETQIHHFAHIQDFTNIRKKAKERKIISTNVLNAIKELEEKIKKHSTNRNLEETTKYLINIDSILKRQYEDLEKVGDVIEQVIISIDGNLTDENGGPVDSPLTSEIKKLEKHLLELEGILIAYTSEINETASPFTSQNLSFSFLKAKNGNFFRNFLEGFLQAKKYHAYDGSKIILDLKEILLARIQNPELFETHIPSGWSIAYKAKSKKFKIIKSLDPKINPLFNEYTLEYLLKEGNYIEINKSNYESLKGKEFDMSKFEINQELTKETFLTHPIWTYIFDNDKNKMEEYWNAHRKRTGLAIKIHEDVYNFRIYPLSINNNNIHNSALVADIGFNTTSKFLLGTPKQ